MKLSKINLRDFCTPSLIYLGISSIVVISVVLQNIFNGNSNELCVGAYKCTFTHKLVVLIFKACIASLIIYSLSIGPKAALPSAFLE